MRLVGLQAVTNTTTDIFSSSDLIGAGINVDLYPEKNITGTFNIYSGNQLNNSGDFTTIAGGSFVGSAGYLVVDYQGSTFITGINPTTKVMADEGFEKLVAGSESDLTDLGAPVSTVNVASGTVISRAEQEGGSYNHVNPLSGEYAVYDVSGQLKAQFYSGTPLVPTGSPVDVSGGLSDLGGLTASQTLSNTTTTTTDTVPSGTELAEAIGAQFGIDLKGGYGMSYDHSGTSISNDIYLNATEDAIKELMGPDLCNTQSF